MVGCISGLDDGASEKDEVPGVVGSNGGVGEGTFVDD